MTLPVNGEPLGVKGLIIELPLGYDIRYQNILLDDLAIQVEDIDVDEDDDADEKDDAELRFEKHSGRVCFSLILTSGLNFFELIFKLVSFFCTGFIIPIKNKEQG